ncbi:MAG: 23S rRNA pseudouridine(1911/1915/1917) synthase RluD [Gammaproteobacteria bacterium]
MTSESPASGACESPEELIATVPKALAGLRFDQALAQLFPRYSRTRLTRWVRAGRVTVETKALSPKDRLQGGERVQLHPMPIEAPAWAPEPLPLTIVYQDNDLLIINKPQGLVVHPGAGNFQGTLVNGLLYHFPELAQIPRAGIVHRLDKDTTGLLVIARSLDAYQALVEQLKRRTVSRDYLGLVIGTVTAGGVVNAPLGRHPVQRTRMAVVASGRSATTRYRVVERYFAYTLLHLSLDTGRTHQIRVHMTHLGHPLLGDPVYGRRPPLPRREDGELPRALQGFARQALHAGHLELEHPLSRRQLRFEAPLPADLSRVIELLRAHREP